MTRFSGILLVFALMIACLPRTAAAQGRNSEVVIEHTGTAFLKTDVLMN